jgi:O-antigen/teichoic acid export membrane protein
MGLTLPGTAVTALLQGLHRYDLANVVATGATLLSALATFVVLSIGGGLLWMVGVNIPIALVAPLVGLLLARRVAPELQAGWRGARWSQVRPILSFSSSAFVIRAAGYLQSKTDEIVVGTFLPLSAVAPYSVGHRLSDLVAVVSDQFLNVVPPVASEAHARAEPEALQELYIASSRMTLAIAVPIACTLMVLAEPLLGAWVGPAFAGGWPLVTVLTAAAVVDACARPGAVVLQGMSRHRPVAIVALGAGVLNLALSVILVQRVGAVGVALGTLIASLAACALVLPYTLRRVGVSSLRWGRDVLLAVLVPGICQLLVLRGLDSVVQPDSALLLLGVALAGGCVYVVVYLGVGARNMERQFIDTALRVTGIRKLH